MAVRPSFLDIVRERVVLLDGAMGTSIHRYSLDLQRDWLGLENCSEILIQTRPDIIQEIHESFLAAGSDAVETNTFGANRIVLAEFGIADKTFELNKRAAEIARKACQKYETPDRPRFVVGSIGPGTKLLTLGQVTWEVMEESYFEQVRGLIAGGVDALLIETAQDLLQIKCAINAATRAMNQAGVKLPLMVQVSMDNNAGQSMLLGSDSSAVVAAILPFDQVDCVGLNCATGPTELTEHVKYFSENWPRLISVLPNAGMPLMVDGRAHFPLTPADFAKGVQRFVEEFGVNIVGGCCGTTPEHIKAVREAIGFRKPKARQVTVKPQISSLISAVDARQETSYLIIAERTNTNGSRVFKRLLQAEDWDGLVSMARDELRDGSHLVDLCVDFVGRDGVHDMHEVAKRFVNALPVPLMLDSTDPKVMETGLKLAGGRCILNSMNLEDGEERVAVICNLAKKYGAAVVAGTIDEDKQNAMARTADRKLAIAQRIRDLAVNKYGMQDADLFFDPLVLPISTGIEEDRRNALETIEGIRRITQQLPDCHTLIGLSNVSFGLKPAARIVLNSAFLNECLAAGLSGAIAHASKILPKNRIPENQWNAALDLIYDRRRDGFDPLTHFVSLFPDDAAAATAAAAPAENLPIEEVLKRHIIDGEKRDLAAHLDEARKTHKPLDIVNDILLEGMKVVGELFGSGQMQLPFVLQSAETMKAAVAHLQPFMEKVEGSVKGKIVLATVKGDVHDIGKNLVDIILTNNGYTVVNLGIKQPIQEILKAAREHHADAIGMSGLLVKSVAVMKENLAEMNTQGVAMPVLLGGAALTRDYAEETLADLYQGSVLYCKDAFDGLRVMDAIAHRHLDGVVTAQRERVEKRRRLRESAVRPQSRDAAEITPIAKDNPVPVPPFWGRRVITDLSARHIFPFVNENALFRGQWGYKQGKLSNEEFARSLEEKARPVFAELQRRAIEEGFLEPKVIYGYFPVQAQGNDLIVYHVEEFQQCTCHSGAPACLQPKGKPRQRLRFTFPRQDGRRRLCISDFFRSVDSGQYDVLGVQLVTMGPKPTALAEKLRADNKYQEYLYLHGLSVESAEALAEFWHKRMRQELGFGSEDAPTIRELFQQHYRGSRYSFGYPACPNLEDRALIVELLHPQDLGVTLSENYMLIPEQSTDALVVHHPQAKYFDI
ncbi:MAG TPA: methionine synthase [Tepidisphaeraceae bacterium]|nr:methionine synthase [Tepidisphaeraceae bacterium]